ncbi:MAG: epoxyqueuosine reductase [Thermodesulfobacteriota bacterium]
MSEDQRTWLTALVSDYVKNSRANSLKMEPDEKAFDDILVGFAAGSDPLYKTYKDVIGDLHWTPLEAFSLKYHDAAVSAEDLTVISWVLPHRSITKADNRKETFYPSRRWVHARFPGEEFNNSLRRHVVQELGRKGVRALAPALLPEWTWEKSPKYAFVSKWSERHSAYAAGLGTFGLCDGLITVKGKAHRVGSVVASLTIPPTERQYDDHHAYCLFFYDGSCTGCQKRCPVGAVTEEGHNKVKCWDHAGGTCGEFVKQHYGFDGYGCGLCQTGVPCESGIPKRILESLKG